MRVARVASAVAVLALLGGSASAQTPARDTTRVVRARIVLIAGGDLHIEVAPPLLLQPGDTLLVRRAGAERGALIVTAADSTRAVVGYAGARFALTRGALLEAELRRAARPDAGSQPLAAPPPQRAVPAGATAPAPARVPARRSAHASGYVTAGTHWAMLRHTGGGDDRTYSVPTASLSMRVTDLPGGWGGYLFARAEQRAARLQPAAPDPLTHVDVFAAVLQGRAGPLRLALGRHASEHDPFGGPWDGIVMEAGGQFGVAGLVGWEPDRASGAPSARHPKAAVSAYLRAAAPAVRYRGTVSARRYLGGVPAERGSLAVTTRQSLSAGPLDLWADLLAETSDSAGLAVQWGGAHAALGPSGGPRLRAGYRVYRPYRTGPADSIAEPATRKRVEGGGYLPIGRAALSVNVSSTADAGTRTIGASSNLFVTGIAGLDLDAAAATWDYADTRTSELGVGAARNFGGLYARVAYRIERGPEPFPKMAHEIDVDAAVMLSRGSSLTTRLTHATAGATTATHVQLRLTWGF